MTENEKSLQNKEEKTGKRVVGAYARVSTGNQGTGLESQVRALRNYCKQNNIDNYLLFTDENQSGVKSSRPALDKMMRAAREGKLSKVVVYSFSRYARSTTHLLNALQEFKKLKIDFISISENIDTSSPLGVAIFSILGAVAQLERDILIERVKTGLANAKAKEDMDNWPLLKVLVNLISKSRNTYKGVTHIYEKENSIYRFRRRHQELPRTYTFTRIRRRAEF